MPPLAEAASSVPRPSAFHVLVVDNNDDDRQSICDLIGHEAYRVTGVATGRGALEFLQEASVDLILTDLMMPDMNGWQILRARLCENYH